MRLLRDEEKEQIKSKVLDIQMILANIEKENNEQVEETNSDFSQFLSC